MDEEEHACSLAFYSAIGHTALECTNLRTLSNDHIADKSEEEAWALLAEASAERDIGDFKDALQVLSKTCPDYTYPKLEREFRGRGFTIFLIAMEKDHGDTYTNVNLQGEIGKKYAVSYFTSATCHRPALVDKWPASPEENLKRLADAGVPMDRGVDKCNNCGKVGHSTRRCPDEKMAPVQPKVTCFLCGEEGHRVRDCTQSRKREGGRACKICESEEHLAKVIAFPLSSSHVSLLCLALTSSDRTVPTARSVHAVTAVKKTTWRKIVPPVRREPATTAARKIIWPRIAPTRAKSLATFALKKDITLA